MHNKLHKFILLLALAAGITACKKDDAKPSNPAPPANEEELITDIYLFFEDHDGNTYEWHASTDEGFHHEHGEGGEHEEGEIHIHGDDLPANEHLHVRILLLNRSVTPADTVSHEVLDEGTEHQFFFIAEDVGITFAYDDADADGRPIGLSSLWETGAPGTGEVKVILRHGPDKGAAGVSNGDITNAGGATDLEVHFPAVVQ